MTGRYSLRTGIRDTYNGGAIMATEEVTVAEMLKQQDIKQVSLASGTWATIIRSARATRDSTNRSSTFPAAWDSPAILQHFFKRDSSYYDPVLWYNGEQKAYEGYCSDIFTDEAVTFIEQAS
jgi:hypothetical protein